MQIFGKSLSEYIQFQKLFLLLILVVGIARPMLSAAGMDNSAVQWISLTGLLLLGCVLYSVWVGATGFGGYPQLLGVLYVQAFFAQLIIALGVALAIVTMQDNVYSVPEFSGGSDGKYWGHAAAHLVIVPIVISLVLSLPGILLLRVTRAKMSTAR